MNSGRRRAGDSLEYKKIYIFLFKTLPSGDPSIHLSFLDCPNFDTIFSRVLKIKILFPNIPRYPPPVAVPNSMTNNFTKQVKVSGYCQKK